ncbi:MAG: tetratricopeptide repeat protein [Alphaproteobacteria bacterium]
MLRAALTTGLLAAAIAGTAVAGPYADAVAAYVAAFARGDYATAMRLLQPLADQGNAGAQSNLGLMYANGQGVSQDHSEAMKWFRKAAGQGVAEAQFNLGLMYGNGLGLPQDYVQAHKWYNLAASRYPASEKEKRDTVVRNRDRVAAKMTPEQIAQAQKLAREWKPK